MVSTVKIYRSTVAGHVPTAEQLAANHIAINEADGKLFWLKSDNTVQTSILTSTPPLTAAAALALLVTVDGTGSGLDADTLDGNQASSFSLAGHTHTGYAVSSVKVEGGGLATGGGDISTNRVITVPKASTPEAVGGTNDATVMTPAKTKDAISTILGKQTIWIPASAMVPKVGATGPSIGRVAIGASTVIVDSLDFDTSTIEYAQFSFRMPKSWDKGTISFSPVWSHAATTTNYGTVWSLAGVAIPDGSSMSVSFGTPATSTDTGGSTDYSYQGPASGAITIAGTLNDNAYIKFLLLRKTDDGSDNLAIDARLEGLHLFITTNALNDS